MYIAKEGLGTFRNSCVSPTHKAFPGGSQTDDPMHIAQAIDFTALFQACGDNSEGTLSAPGRAPFNQTHTYRCTDMENPIRLKRKAFPNRPWITGKLYDDMSRSTVMHMDAWTFLYEGKPYLLIDFREGGFKQIALDAWMIEADGLVEAEGYVVEQMRLDAEKRFWTSKNNLIMSGIHKHVLAWGQRMMGFSRGRWTVLMTRCHYVHVKQVDPEIPRERNFYKPYGSQAAHPVRKLKGPLDTVRTIKRRGRPPKPKTVLPDIL